MFYPRQEKISVVIEDDAHHDVAVTTARQAFDKGPGQVFLLRRGSCFKNAAVRQYVTTPMNWHGLNAPLLVNFARVERTIWFGRLTISGFLHYISQRSGERYDQMPGYMTTVVRSRSGSCLNRTMERARGISHYENWLRYLSGILCT